MSGARFVTELDVRLMDDAENDGRGRWRLLAVLIYYSAVAGREIVVPAGSETDFASVPRLPVVFWLAGDRAHAAAVVHDWLYTSGELPRAVADEVFLEAMAVAGIGVWLRYPMYWAVRAAGGGRYVVRQGV